MNKPALTFTPTFPDSNTQSTPAGLKTRHFTSILSELRSALQIHRQHNSFLGGVHLELTGDAVTECVGGSEGLLEKDLSLNYTTYCDPRLNEKQALELAFLVAGFYRGEEQVPVVVEDGAASVIEGAAAASAAAEGLSAEVLEM